MPYKWWLKRTKKYEILIDFTKSSDKLKASDNLKKYGQDITETERSTNYFFNQSRKNKAYCLCPREKF